MSDEAPRPGTRKAKAYEITCRAAYRAWEQTHRPRPTKAQACQFLAVFFPEPHACMGACPSFCPKQGGDPAQIVSHRPDHIVSQPEYARETTANSVEKSAPSADNVTVTTETTPPIMRDEEEDPGDVAPPAPVDPVDSTRFELAPEPATSTYEAPPAAAAASSPALSASEPAAPAKPRRPPCAGCGRYMPITIVMRPGVDGQWWILCSACYRGGPPLASPGRGPST